METEELKKKVIELICKHLDTTADKITMETKYAEDLGADSLDTAELVMEFEDEFDINVSDDAEGKIKSVGDTVNYIAEQMKKKAEQGA